MVMDCRRSCSTDGVSDDDDEDEEEGGEDDNDDAHAQRTGSVPDLKKLLNKCKSQQCIAMMRAHPQI